MRQIDQCQHVEDGKCAPCTNFRNKDALKKHLQDRPFAPLAVLVNDGVLRYSFKRMVIRNRSGKQEIIVS